MIDVQTYRLDIRKIYGDPEQPRATLMINATIDCTSHTQIIETMMRYLDEAAATEYINGYEIDVEVIRPKYLHADVRIRMLALGDHVSVLEQVAAYISANRHQHYD